MHWHWLILIFWDESGFISLAALSILTSMVKDICLTLVLVSWLAGVEAPIEQCPQGSWWHCVSTDLQTRIRPQILHESRANCETVLHMQPRASLLCVGSILARFSIYTNSLTVSGTTDAPQREAIEHRVFHMKIFKQKELKKSLFNSKFLPSS